MRLACREIGIEDKYATTGAVPSVGDCAQHKESNGSGRPRGHHM